MAPEIIIIRRPLSGCESTDAIAVLNLKQTQSSSLVVASGMKVLRCPSVLRCPEEKHCHELPVSQDFVKIFLHLSVSRTLGVLQKLFYKL